MYRKKKVAVVIPAHNEEAHIGDVLDSIPDYVDYIIVINDASTDRTAEIIEKAKLRDPRIIVKHHEKNTGVGGAIYDGYKIAWKKGADITVVIAGDGQMDPRYMPALMDPIVEDKADYTKGNRLQRDLSQMPELRRFGNALLTMMTKFVSGYWNIQDPQNGYTAINRRAMKSLIEDGFFSGYGYCNDILVKLNANGFRVWDVMIPARYGTERSGIRLHKYIPTLSWILLKDFFWRLKRKYGGVNLHPIFFLYTIGITLTLFGLITGLIAGYLKWYRNLDVTAGTANLIMLIMVIGIQSFMFAFMFDEMQNRHLQNIIWGKPVNEYELKDVDIEHDRNPDIKTTFDFSPQESHYEGVVEEIDNVPTLTGIFRRIKEEYWGINLHPLVAIYILGFTLFVTGLILGLISIYARFVLNNPYSIPTIILSSLLIIIGTQSIFFGLVLEMEVMRFRKSGTKANGKDKIQSDSSDKVRNK